MDNWSYYKRPLTLNEIVEEIENLENDSDIPDEIIMLPPENATAEITDEDSGSDDEVTIHNLPGSHLRAEAEVVRVSNMDEDLEFDAEDDLSLSFFVRPTQAETQTVVASARKKIYCWRKRDLDANIFPNFENTIGPKNNLSPIDYYTQFFDSGLINTIVRYSNLYASQKGRSADIAYDEIMCFIGVLLLSGYNSMSRRMMYWENSTDSGNTLVYNAISRNRFSYIMQNLHCADNLHLNPTDKFSKLRPLFDYLNEKFIDLAPSEEFHSVDESMVPYFGRHGSKQFIRGKPIRWGYKLWAGTTRLGYVEWFEAYQGSTTIIDPKYKDLGLGASVVLHFCDVLTRNKGNLNFHIFFDNFFTSILLINELTSRGLKATGTVRENRVANCPLSHSKTIKKEHRGYYDYATTDEGNILICKWHDNNVVSMASNSSGVFPIGKVERYSQKEKKKISINQPRLIKMYNENMGGVDRADQNISLYRTAIRGKKWYFPLFCQCIDMAVQNSWQLHKHNGGKLDHLAFRRFIAQGILETHKKSKKRGPVRINAHVHEHSRYDTIDHLVMYQENQRKCAYCHKKCNFSCCKCDLGLHPKDCFYLYHKK